MRTMRMISVVWLLVWWLAPGLGHASGDDKPAAAEAPLLELLRLAGTGPGDVVLALGTGDGPVLMSAARRLGARALGAGARSELDRATVVALHPQPEANMRLRPELLALKPGTRLVSQGVGLGDWSPDRTASPATPARAAPRDRRARLLLWVVPAKVQGLWCGAGLLRGTRMQLTQAYQVFQGTIERRGRTRTLEGRIDGVLVRSSTGKAAQLGLELDGDALRIVSTGEGYDLLRGSAFRRAAGTRCD